jgi:hypothetical protein
MNPTLLQDDPPGRCGAEGLRHPTWRTRDPQGRLSAAPLGGDEILLFRRIYGGAKMKQADRRTGNSDQPHPLVRIATLERKVAQLEQRLLKLEESQSVQDESAALAANPRTGPTSSSEPVFEIIGIDSRVTEANSSWSKFAWKLTLQNLTDRPLILQATIEFLDGERFVVDDSFAPDLLLRPYSENTFTGYKLITAGVVHNVTQVNAKVNLQ